MTAELDRFHRDLKQVVERQITQRTWGRIHRLHVEVLGDRLVVHGCTATYYAKQLALEAALEALNSTDLTTVDLDIQVGSAPFPVQYMYSPGCATHH